MAIKVPKNTKVTLSEREKCIGRGGVWDAKTQTCGDPSPELLGRSTAGAPNITTRRQQQIQEEEAQAVRESETRDKAKSDAIAAEAALDKPITGLTIKTGEVPTSGEEQGIGGVTENGVFFEDEPKRGSQQIIFDERGRASGIVKPDGTALTGLTQDEVQGLLQSGAVAADAQQQPNLAAGVGQFGQAGIQGTGFDETALAGAAARGVIPGLIRAAGGAVTAGVIGAKVGALGGPGTAITLGALGFASGIATSILSEMKTQRTDNTNAQQRVLDEGKQVLSDWVTFAEANPSQKELALAGFNTQLALIDKAYRQMKLDTSQDVLAFESAVPNIAEFIAFYSASGERDVYSDEMRIALTQVAPIDTRLLDLINRRAG